MEKLVPSFEKSLFNDDVNSLLANISELGIDSILDESLFKDLPIVGILIGVTKTTQRLQERNLLKQTLIFIKTFNDHKIDLKKLDKYKEKIKNNSKFAEEELGRVLLLLNSNLDSEKSVYLSKFFIAYIEDGITWTEFCEFSEIISNVFLSDIKYLLNINHKKINRKKIEKYQNYQKHRLISIGLMILEITSIDEYKAKRRNSTAKASLYVTDLGKKFCEIINS